MNLSHYIRGSYILINDGEVLFISQGGLNKLMCRTKHNKIKHVWSDDVIGHYIITDNVGDREKEMLYKEKARDYFLKNFPEYFI